MEAPKTQSVDVTAGFEPRTSPLKQSRQKSMSMKSYARPLYMALCLGLTVMLTAGLTACAHTAQSSQAAQSSHVTSSKIETEIMSPQIIQLTSRLSFDATVTKLRAGIEARPLTLFAEIDHAAGAAKAGLSQPPSTLFIFGNPKGGTPLMTRNPQMGIVLPLRMHVYQEGDTVFITYPDIQAIAQSHGLETGKQPLPNIAALLKGLADEISA